MRVDDRWRPGGSAVSRALAQALDAAAHGDGATVRDTVRRSAGVEGWHDVMHRLDVAGRALALDAGDAALDDRALITAEAEIARRAPWASPDEVLGVVEHLRRWRRGGVDGIAEPELAVWSLVLAVDWLRRCLGYPPQVVA